MFSRLRRRDIADARLSGFRALADYERRPDGVTSGALIESVLCPACRAEAGQACRGPFPDAHTSRGWLKPDGSLRFHIRRVTLAETVAGGPLWPPRSRRPPVSGHELHLAIRDALEDLVEAAQCAYEQTSLHPKITQIPDLTFVWEAVAKLTEAEAAGGTRR